MKFGAFVNWLHRPTVFLFIFALFLRLIGNTISPPSPYWEEAALGYDAYSILKTGKDHHGDTFPLVAFTSFGDYKPSLYFYAVVPSVAVFGLNTFAVRFPAALASAGTVVLLYLIARRWTNERVARWSALLLAVQPWSWQIGRAGFEVNLAVFLMMLGVERLNSLLTTARPKKKEFWIQSALAAAAFVLSMYAYHGARLLAPLFALTIFAFHTDWRVVRKKPQALLRFWWPALLTAVVLVVPLLVAFRSPVVQQRIRETSLFSETAPVERSNFLREFSPGKNLGYFTNHRFVMWGYTILENYLVHLSPQFLFGQGENNPRHSSYYFGMLYPWEFFTILLGIAFGAAFFRKAYHAQLALTLTLLAPLAAMLTTATPHALRSLPLGVFMALWSGIGMTHLELLLQKHLKRLKLQRIVPVGLGLFVLGSAYLMLAYFLEQYPKRFAHEWQYGYQELMDTLSQEQRAGEPIFVSRFQGRPAMYLFFTKKIDPKRVQAADVYVPKDQQEFLQFENWNFVDGVPGNKGLFALPAADALPEGHNEIRTISDFNGQPLWRVSRKQ